MPREADWCSPEGLAGHAVLVREPLVGNGGSVGPERHVPGVQRHHGAARGEHAVLAGNGGDVQRRPQRRRLRESHRHKVPPVLPRVAKVFRGSVEGV
eukprot:883791-Pyramimonas_sp.AAC.1